jgi:hypothetical protein
MKFFKDVQSIEDLKKQYRKLAKKYHPDCGGTDADMKVINNEYEKLFAQFQQGGQAGKHKMNDGFREVIEKLIKLNIDIEICGSWIWLGGNTFSVKEELKALGCRWSKGKKLWYWTADELTGRKRTTEMEKIREAYGSEIVKTASKPKQIA